MGRVLAVLAAVMSCLVAGCASNPPGSSLQPLAVTSSQGPTGSASLQEPVNKIDLSALDRSMDRPYVQGAIVFLTDQTLAVSVCGNAGCNLATFDFANGNTRQVELMNDVPRFSAILRGREGGVVLSGVRRGRQIGLVLLDPDLHTSQWIPRVPGVSPTGEKIPDGQGRFLGHTANVAAYLDQGTVRIKGFDGRLLGSFDAGSSGRDSIPLFCFLGQDRLLFKGGGRLAVLDYNGKVLRTLRRQEHGWGSESRTLRMGTDCCSIALLGALDCFSP